VLVGMLRFHWPLRLPPSHPDFGAAVALWYAVGAGLTLSLALASYHLYELRFLRWKEKLAPVAEG